MANDIAEKPAAAEEGVWTTGPDGELIPDYDAAFPEINEGEVVHGTVVRVDKDEVLVDIGYKSEGVIPVAELTIRRSVNPADEVSVGEEIDALVLTKEDAEGPPHPLEEARPLRARVEAHRGRCGVRRAGHRQGHRGRQGRAHPRPRRTRLPAGVARRHPARPGPRRVPRQGAPLQGHRAQPLAQQRRALASRRPRGRAQGDAQAILDRLSPGDVIEGQISNIVDFGAFVDLDGMDGLIHISELSWSHVNHPSEVLDIGQTVKVKVLDIDRDRQRISLGLKQTQTDPWQQVVDSYREDDVVEGRVAKVVTFGAFVEILPASRGSCTSRSSRRTTSRTRARSSRRVTR
jgi:small subunit ribosomal protein S1